MKIAVIGAGAIGSVVAAYLAKAGEDIVLVGRKDQVDAINSKGLSLKGVRGEETIRLKALTKLDQTYDLVIFAVKTQDIEDAYQNNCEFLEHCLVMTSQNGVQADNLLSGHYDKDKIISSIVMFGATYIRPGEVTFNFDANWIIGKPYTPMDPTVHKIADILRKAFKVQTVDDIMGMKWLKLFINFNNCIPALTGKSMQETFADMDLCRLAVMLLKEGVHIVETAKIELVSLPDFPKERTLGLAAMPVEQGAAVIHKVLTGLSKEPLYGSILQSIMRGKTSEIDFINGEVVQLASHFRIPATLNARVVDMVHEVERTGRFFTPEEIKQTFFEQPSPPRG
jgi:2-dehydropantoate 2-reductase